MSDQTDNPNISDDAVLRAFHAFNQRKTSDARAICQSVLEKTPDHAAAWMVLGLIEIEERTYDQAVTSLRKSLDLSQNPWVYANLASCLCKLGRLNEALECAQAAVAMQHDFAEGHSTLATILHGLRRFDEALASANEALRLNPEAPVAIARIGSILAHLGRFDEAEQYFASTAHLTGSSPHYQIVNFQGSLFHEIQSREDNDIDTPLWVHGPQKSGGFDFVVMSACNVAYFYKYGFNFINSFSKNAALNNILHLHIIDPDARFPAVLRKLVNEINLPNLVVTVEHAPLDGTAAADALKTYYSCGRFMQMNFLLGHYQKPILCFDIDAIFEASVGSIIEYVKGKDVGLILREPLDSPWLNIVAHVVVANPTPDAARYFRLVRNYVLHFMDRGKSFWHLDQIALYCVLKMMGRYVMAPEVAWIPQSFQRLVWQIGQGYDYKLKDERFTKYSLR